MAKKSGGSKNPGDWGSGNYPGNIPGLLEGLTYDAAKDHDKSQSTGKGHVNDYAPNTDPGAKKVGHRCA